MLLHGIIFSSLVDVISFSFLLSFWNLRWEDPTTPSFLIFGTETFEALRILVKVEFSGGRHIICLFLEMVIKRCPWRKFIWSISREF